LVRVKEIFEPEPKEVALYEERFSLYRDLYPLMREWLHRVHQLSSQ